MITIAAVTLAFVLGAVPVAKAPHIARQIDTGRDVLRTGDYVRAEAELQAAIDAAKREGDNISGARALFFLGLSKQERAAKALPDESQRLRKEAASHYEASLALYPTAGATLNNLADMYLSFGDENKAKQQLENAAKFNEGSAGYYYSRIGEIEEKGGHFDAAVKWYRKAAIQKEPPPGIEQRVVNTYLKTTNERDDFLAYLWSLLQKGSADVALTGAIDAFKTGDLDKDDVDAAFGIIATAVARRNYTISQLRELGLVPDLKRIGADARYEARVTALFAVMEGQLKDSASFLEWPLKVNDDDIPSDLSPRGALAELSAVLGRRAMSDKSNDRAIEYFDVSRELGRVNDLQVIFDLSTLYFKRKDYEEFSRLTYDADTILYGEDKVASRIDPMLLYEYHRTIGTYSSIAPPATVQGPASTRYQLYKAIDAANAAMAAGAEFRVDDSINLLLMREEQQKRKASKK